MSSDEMPELTGEIQQRLERADSQLTLYARDLKRVVDLERKKSRELADANERLKILSRLKTDFLSFISHELRTPLNAMSMIDLFDPTSDPKEQTELIEIIRRGYERLQQFILKGLEYFSWLAEDKIDPTATADLAAVVRQAAQCVPDLAEPGVDFRIVFPEVPCRVRGNQEHLVEVVKILLENAVKFSPGDKFIRVNYCRTLETVTLAVTDRGVGLQPEIARELFQPFTIADVKHHSAGTGLNLALASVIVAAHGGRIHAESEGVGKGTQFVIDFLALTSSDPT